MTLFFLLVGLEIKRERRDGDRSNPTQVAPPLAAALGGMAVPALICFVVNLQRPEALNDWAIPSPPESLSGFSSASSSCLSPSSAPLVRNCRRASNGLSAAHSAAIPVSASP